MPPSAENGVAEEASSLDVSIGVLALQGAFREHIAHLNKLPGVSQVEVRRKEQLADVDGLIIPGGDCTSALMHGLLYGQPCVVKSKQCSCMVQERAPPWHS